MCFVATPEETRALRKRMKAHGGVMDFWKIVRKDRLSWIRPERQHYQRGSAVKANRQRRRVRWMSREMAEGIYVYTVPPLFIPLCDDKMIVHVRCSEKDLIGASDADRMACFRKVEVLT